MSEQRDGQEERGPPLRWLGELKEGLEGAVGAAVRDGLAALKNLGGWARPPEEKKALDIGRDVKDEERSAREDDTEQKRIDYLKALGGVIPFVGDFARGEQKMLDISKAWKAWDKSSQPPPPEPPKPKPIIPDGDLELKAKPPGAKQKKFEPAPVPRPKGMKDDDFENYQKMERKLEARRHRRGELAKEKHYGKPMQPRGPKDDKDPPRPEKALDEYEDRDRRLGLKYQPPPEPPREKPTPPGGPTPPEGPGGPDGPDGRHTWADREYYGNKPSLPPEMPPLLPPGESPVSRKASPEPPLMPIQSPGQNSASADDPGGRKQDERDQAAEGTREDIRRLSDNLERTANALERQDSGAGGQAWEPQIIKDSLAEDRVSGPFKGH